MTHPSDDMPELTNAAEVVLGLLSDEDRVAFRGQMMQDPALRAEVTLWSEHFAALTDDIAPVTPPATVLQASQLTLFGPPQPRWPRLLRLFAGGALVAVSLYLLVSPFVFDRNSRDNDLLATLQSADQYFVMNAAFDPDTGRLFVQPVNAAGWSAERDYEVWLIAGDAAPVSLGLVPRAEQGSLEITPQVQTLMAGGTLAVSVEPLGGSPTGAPTGEVLAVAQLQPQDT
jgi:anti-sigma-K factor RskA